MYNFLKILNDANSVKQGKVGKRVARKSAGRVAGKGLRKVIK